MFSLGISPNIASVIGFLIQVRKQYGEETNVLVQRDKLKVEAEELLNVSILQCLANPRFESLWMILYCFQDAWNVTVLL